MKKHLLIGAAPLLAALLFAACTPQPMNEDAIEADFIETAGNLLPAAETLDSFEIIERNTDNETQTDEIICRIGEENVSYLGDDLINMLIEMFIGFDIGYQSVSGIGVSGAWLGDTEVVGRDTSLAQKTDKLTVSVELEHDVLTATGELQFD